jgi:hypothetical protein
MGKSAHQKQAMVTTWKIKINWKNGATGVVFSKGAPNVNPVTPGFMGFKIDDGKFSEINLSEVRSYDIEVIHEAADRNERILVR